MSSDRAVSVGDFLKLAGLVALVLGTWILFLAGLEWLARRMG